MVVQIIEKTKEDKLCTETPIKWKTKEEKEEQKETNVEVKYGKKMMVEKKEKFYRRKRNMKRV